MRIYGDGADAAQKFEIMSILPVLCASSSTLDSRILCSVRNADKTTSEARDLVLKVMAWSFASLRIWDVHKCPNIIHRTCVYMYACMCVSMRAHVHMYLYESLCAASPAQTALCGETEGEGERERERETTTQ